MVLTVAVAGGSGFIGRHVVARLLDAGHRVVILARGQREPGAVDPAAAARIETRAVDLGEHLDGGEALAALVGDCQAVVNLVGVKREARGGLSFEAAHVEVPRSLAKAAGRAGIERFVHVSVAGARRHRSSTYLDTKARGEAAVFEALPAATVLRPGVVYGPGDDMLRNLADSVRAAPVFPAPRAATGSGFAEIDPVAVEDVAEAVLRCVESPDPGALAGETIDVVGPERMTLDALVARVAASPTLAKRCWVLGLPAWTQRPAAAVMERLWEDPLITRSQLDLLSEGVTGDGGPARARLGLEARPLDEAAMAAALCGACARLPSVRLCPDAASLAELRALAGGSRASALRSLAFAVFAVLALLAGPWLIESIWLRMAALELVLLSTAVLALPLGWAALARPSWPRLAWALGAGVVLWAGALGVAFVLARVSPQLWAASASLYAWTELLPLGASLGLLVIIVAGEEIVWRGALGLGLAPLIGPWPAIFTSALLFTLAHLTTGPPVLAVAAALAGFAWTWLAIRTRSLFAPFVCHLLWDAALLWVTPL